MKTTIDISDALLEEAKKVASQEHTSVRALIEHGLRRILAERKRSAPFKMRKASFKGKGLHPEIDPGAWERIRDLAYEGHGT